MSNKSLTIIRCLQTVSCGINPAFAGLSPTHGQVTYALLTRAPVASGIAPLLPLDLHVLGLSLAFILSQDQTLRCKYRFFPCGIRINFFEDSCNSKVSTIDGKAKTELITNYKLLITLASHCSTFVLTDLSVRLCTTCISKFQSFRERCAIDLEVFVRTVFLSFCGCKDRGFSRAFQIILQLFSKFLHFARF